MERGQQPGQGFEAIEARAGERNDRGQRLVESDPRLDIDLEALAVAEIIETDILAIAADVGGRRDRGCRFGAGRESGGRRREEEGAGVILGQPGDRSFSRRRLRIDGEIATPNVAGFSRSGFAGRLSVRAAPENPGRRPRFGEATPRPDRMRSCRRRAHKHRRIASRLHRVSRRSSLAVESLANGRMVGGRAPRKRKARQGAMPKPHHLNAEDGSIRDSRARSSSAPGPSGCRGHGDNARDRARGRGQRESGRPPATRRRPAPSPANGDRESYARGRKP